MSDMSDDSEEMGRKPIRVRFMSLRTRVMFTMTVLLVIGAGVTCIVWIAPKNSNNGLPPKIVSQVSGFDLYYLKPNFSTDFKLQKNTVGYSNGLLVFDMENTVGKSLIFTEESLPSHFNTALLQTTSNTATEFGRAYITNDPDRTVGTLLTVDNTWIIINAPNPIGSSLMQQFLLALKPHSLRHN